MLIQPGEILKNINSPSDLKSLSKKELKQVNDELRQYIIDCVSVYGGHFGASLGVVELTTAIHYVFNTPEDKLIWDVGHQAYGHKILTGRRDIFHTNRTHGGISGFPKISESEYDAFGVGHSSTSISAALGMAIASQLQGKDSHHIAVIGDGALTGGMAFEALNHAGITNSNLLIILNDNNMSIDPNVGALRNALTEITTSKPFNKVRDEFWGLLGKVDKLGVNSREIMSKFEKASKTFLSKQSNLFESLNLRYFGPIDGHNLDQLTSVLSDIKNIPGPKILHCITTKGKGYALAEKDQTKWHAPGTFDKVTGKIDKKINTVPQAPKYQDVFGHTLVELAEKNDKIVGITPAMPSGCSMNIMMEKMPNRAFDVGIAEQHAVTLSAGMATQGIIPFCNVYSTFMQRAYDQIIHDVCIQNLHVVFCLDRAGLVGADGGTHHGNYDIAYMRCLPNIVISAPMNEEELRNMMYTAQLPREGAFSIRYPRGKGVMPEWKQPLNEMEVGKGRKIKDGNDLAILSLGHIGNTAITATKILEEQGISVAHFDMRFAKPLDEKLLHEIFSKHDTIITLEDGCIKGGFGSAILEFMSDNGYKADVTRLGIPDKVVEHGTQEELYTECGYDLDGIVNTASELMSKKKITNDLILQ